jgi:hypothetical protein
VGWRRNQGDLENDPRVFAKKGNTWEFVKKENGTHAVVRNGLTLLDSIPAQGRAEAFCIRFGFCGQEFKDMIEALEQSERFVIVL